MVFWNFANCTTNSVQELPPNCGCQIEAHIIAPSTLLLIIVDVAVAVAVAATAEAEEIVLLLSAVLLDSNFLI